jgi:hypothetical protein
MKSISFYKPNSYNKGSASQFQFGLKEGDSGMYVSIVKQSSWNDKTKRGSFSANAKNPKANKKIKLNAAEAAGMCRVIESDVDKWSSVHKTQAATTSIMFSHYIKEGNKLGYGLSVKDSGGESFMLSLTNEEGYVLKSFLQEYIRYTFSQKYSDESQVESQQKQEVSIEDF